MHAARGGRFGRRDGGCRSAPEGWNVRKRNTPTFWLGPRSRIAAVVLVLAANLLGFGPALTGDAVPSASAASLGANLDQCANDTTPCAWQNGDLNGNNSAYAEGDVVPFRLAVEGLAPGSHTIHINYDFTAGGHEAYDFLATYNATETVNPCAAGGGAVSSLCPI